MIKAVSLFTGAGGMDVGFEAAGVDVLLADSYQQKVHRRYASSENIYGQHTGNQKPIIDKMVYLKIFAEAERENLIIPAIK